MNRVESFALQSALKISAPYIESHFYPTLLDRYITFNSHGEEPARHYTHLPEVINLITPYLAKEGIGIYQIGSSPDIPIGGCESLVNRTSINQASYVIKNSLLHFGVNNLLSHLAAFHDTRSLCLYSNKPESTTAPLWNKKSHTAIETFKDFPSFESSDSQNSINDLPPEEISILILDQLEISHDLSSHTTINFGPLYYNEIFEVVPDFTPDPGFFPNTLLNIRLDYHFDPDILPAFLNSHKAAIFLEDKLEAAYLSQFANSIERINVNVDKIRDHKYLDQLKETGIFTALFSKDSKNLDSTRRDFFDWRIENINKRSKKDLDNSIESCDNLKYKSSKLLFSKGKTYLSKSAWNKGIEKKESNQVIDDSDFWEEMDHFYIFKNHEKK
tara:strand:- start:24673 stop:25833 length:1161 start_codon:yes stop_codon:yes gene_type:complete